jgi:hypothetical protein
MLIWNANTDVNGTSFRTELNLDLTQLARLSGLDPFNPQNYYAPDDGYDGWELQGTFDGQPFNLYTRWGQLRIGGRDNLNVLGLIDALSSGIKA